MTASHATEISKEHEQALAKAMKDFGIQFSIRYILCRIREKDIIVSLPAPVMISFFYDNRGNIQEEIKWYEQSCMDAMDIWDSRITGLIKADEGIELVAGIDKYTGIANDYPVFESLKNATWKQMRSLIFLTRQQQMPAYILRRENAGCSPVFQKNNLQKASQKQQRKQQF